MMIWCQMRGKAPARIRETVNAEMSRKWLNQLAADWATTKPGRKARVDGNDRILYYSDGKMAGVLWVDPLPQREKVQPRKGASA